MENVDVSSLPTLTVITQGEVFADPRLDQVEAPFIWIRPPATFVADLSGQNFKHSLLQYHMHECHGTYRKRFANHQLFGHHHFHAVIDSSLRLTCQDIKGTLSRLDYHISHHPGRQLPIPQIYKYDATAYRVDYSKVPDKDIVDVPGSIYFATPTEPLNWGMWLLQALPAAWDFIENAPAERIMIYADRPWQRSLLQTIGIPESRVVHQELGQCYRCEDVVVRQYSHVDLVPTLSDRRLYAYVAQRFAGTAEAPARRKIFLSRKDITMKSGGRYRALLNEEALIEALAQRGFQIVEPETLSFADQVRLFWEAELVVGLGGAALFNVVFCKPGTRVVSIESSTNFVNGHSMLFGSLGHKFGVVFGKQELDDPEPIHKAWTIDVAGALAAIDRF